MDRLGDVRQDLLCLLRFSVGISLSLVSAAKSTSAPVVSNIQVQPNPVSQYERFTVTFSLNTTYVNPYDPAEVDAVLQWRPVGGGTLTVAAFWYERGTTQTWMGRLACTQAGAHEFRLRVTDGTGTTTTSWRPFSCAASGKRGFIRRDPHSWRYLRTSDGNQFFSLGQNVAWHGMDAGGYEGFFQKMQGTGQNSVRIWLVRAIGQGLEGMYDNGPTYFRGLGKYSQVQSYKLDDILDLCVQYGIYAQLALDSFNSWTANFMPEWGTNPYNAANGGILAEPVLYFSDPQARTLAKRLFRYIVARWGWCPNVLAWELFNEVDAVDDFWANYYTIVAWHDEMSTYLVQTDPWQHLVTTSNVEHMRPDFGRLANIGITQGHKYSDLIPQAFVTMIDTNLNLEKPTIMGEYGTSTALCGDTSGVSVRRTIWTAALRGSAGWSWCWHEFDSYGHHQIYAPLAAYLEGLEWGKHNVSPASFTAEGGNGATAVYGCKGPDRAFGYNVTGVSGTASGVRVLVPDLQPGWYRTEFRSVQTGSVIRADEDLVHGGGTFELACPDYYQEVAFKVLPMENAPTPTPAGDGAFFIFR